MELKFKDISKTKVFGKVTVCQAVKIGKKEFISFEEDREGYAVAVDGELKFNLKNIDFDRYNIVKLSNGVGKTAKCTITDVTFESIKDAIIRDRNNVMDITNDVLMADGRRIERYTYIGDKLYSVAKNGRMYPIESYWNGYSIKKKNPSSGEEYFIYSDASVRDIEDFVIFAYGLRRD